MFANVDNAKFITFMMVVALLFKLLSLIPPSVPVQSSSFSTFKHSLNLKTQLYAVGTTAFDGYVNIILNVAESSISS